MKKYFWIGFVFMFLFYMASHFPSNLFDSWEIFLSTVIVVLVACTLSGLMAMGFGWFRDRLISRK